MGKIIKTCASNILPSQNFVKEGTIKFILECIQKGELDKLPPTPIVRNNPNGNGYIAIDGHNLLVINSLLGKNCEIYVADSSTDKLNGETNESIEAISQRNSYLAQKFERVFEESQKITKQGIKNIDDLKNKYNYLIDIKTANRHFGIK